MQFGELPTGGYFWRPPYINHGAFASELGCIAIGRTDSKLFNHFHYNPWSTPDENQERSAARLAKRDPVLYKWCVNHVAQPSARSGRLRRHDAASTAAIRTHMRMVRPTAIHTVMENTATTEPASSGPKPRGVRNKIRLIHLLVWGDRRSVDHWCSDSTGLMLDHRDDWGWGLARCRVPDTLIPDHTVEALKNRHIMLAQANPDDNNNWVVGGPTGAWQSRDDGDNWTSIEFAGLEVFRRWSSPSSSTRPVHGKSCGWRPTTACGRSIPRIRRRNGPALTVVT